jgi:DNA polymerase-1
VTKVKEPTTLLIDSDIVAFQFASSHQKTHNWEPGVTSREVADIEEIKPKIAGLFDVWKERLKADAIVVCLSVPSAEGFRKGILPSYKENRAGIERPELLMPLKEHLAEAYPSYIRPTLEADDVMGILSTHPTLVPGKKIIVSEDKDMKTIPGWLWNPAKDKQPWRVTSEEAAYWHMYQTLTGDAVDHYAGCPGIGPDKAKYALQELKKRVPEHKEVTRGPNKGEVRTKWVYADGDDYWDVVVSHFHAAGLTEEDALVQARVARILHASDYDFKNKEVKLWTPPRSSS